MDEGGLDTEKIAMLERWATGLNNDPRPEVAAAGRAILMLIDEVERLHVLLWKPALYPQSQPEVEATELVTTLRGRLRLRRKTKTQEIETEETEAAVFHSESTPPTASDTGKPGPG